MAWVFSYDFTHLPEPLLVEEPKPRMVRVGDVEVEDWSHVPMSERCKCPEPTSPEFDSTKHGLEAPPRVTNKRSP